MIAMERFLRLSCSTIFGRIVAPLLGISRQVRQLCSAIASRNPCCRQQGFLDAIAEQSCLTCREIPSSGATILPKIVEQLSRKNRSIAIIAFYDDVTRYAAQAIEMSKAGKAISLYG